MAATDQKFDTGATRDQQLDKYDYEGFLSPRVLEAYAAYMHKNRHRPDGTFRDSDNWQKGIPFNSYMKSALRHVVDWWSWHRDLPRKESLEEALCGVIFNASGYLHEHLKKKEEF